MDNESLIRNIILLCAKSGEPPTNACFNAGVGKSFISNIRRGQTPSVAKVADLAKYLHVCTSDLIGDKTGDLDLLSPGEGRLLELYLKLNDEGQDKLLDYADDLVSSGKYIKSHADRMGKKA